MSVLYSFRLLYRKVLYRKNSRYLSSVRDFCFCLDILAWTLGRIDGIIFLIIFAGYLLWMIRSAKRARHNITSADSSSAQKVRSSLSEEEIEQVASHINLLPLWKCLIFILGGMIAIKYGGDFVVDGASSIASSLGLSQTLIGLTIIAMGTSLPELVTSTLPPERTKSIWQFGNVTALYLQISFLYSVSRQQSVRWDSLWKI